MEPTIPTIEALKCKPKGELRAIFRKAAEASVAAAGPAHRAAARKTMDIVHRCLAAKP